MPKTIAFLALVLAFASAASADEQVWTKSFDVKGTPDVILKSNDAHVTVNAGGPDLRLIFVGDGVRHQISGRRNRRLKLDLVGVRDGSAVGQHHVGIDEVPRKDDAIF